MEPGGYATPIFSRIGQPDDTERAADYAALSFIPERFFGAMQPLFGPEAPDPQEVADVIDGLVATTAGQRPLRTIVGRVVPTPHEINEVSERVALTVLGQLGLDDLLTLAEQPRSMAA